MSQIPYIDEIVLALMLALLTPLAAWLSGKVLGRLERKKALKDFIAETLAYRGAEFYCVKTAEGSIFMEEGFVSNIQLGRIELTSMDLLQVVSMPVKQFNDLHVFWHSKETQRVLKQTLIKPNPTLDELDG